MTIPSLSATTPAEPARRLAVPAGSTSRRIAVFGSVDAERPPRPVVATPSSTAREVLEAVYAAIAEKAPRIARPILDRAVDERAITAAQRDELLLELTGRHDEQPAARNGTVATELLRESLVAIRLASPAIAAPILDEAVAGGRVTAEQAGRILERLRSSPTAALRATSREQG